MQGKGRSYRAFLVPCSVPFSSSMRELEEAGADIVFNFSDEAGSGFAEQICRKLEAG